ncbi:MAG: DUF402 domain-containing protein [Actinomycetota bacterium]
MDQASSVYCDMRKWETRQHYHFNAARLGSDEHGIWLGVPEGTPFDGPYGPQVYPASFVICAAPDRWWLASWWDLRVERLDFGVYVDMATPCEWLTPNHVRTIDLDLDVIHHRDGRIYVDDEDEFEQHRVEYAYPDDIVANARAACDEVLAMMRKGAEPFATAGPTWLAKLLGEAVDLP